MVLSAVGLIRYKIISSRVKKMSCTRCDCKRTSTLRLRVHPAIILDSRVISESSFIKLAEKRKKKKTNSGCSELTAVSPAAACRCTRCSAPSGIWAPSLRCTLRMETLWLRYVFLYHIARGT